MGFGSQGYGTGPFGDGSQGASTVLGFRILIAFPLTSQTFRVIFSEEPSNQDPLSPVAASNRQNWALSNVGGVGEPLAVTRVLTVEPAPMFSTGAAPNPWAVDIAVDSRILIQGSYVVVASNIVSKSSGQALSSNPLDRATFPGLSNPRPRRRVRPRVVRRSSDFKYDTFGGRYVLDARNDYETHGGLEALRKRILRRLISSPGGFFHLDEYGAGLQVKEVNRTTNAAAIQGDVEDQLRQEELVRDFQVAVDNGTPGILRVELTVQTADGPIVLGLDIPEDGPVQVA